MLHCALVSRSKVKVTSSHRLYVSSVPLLNSETQSCTCVIRGRQGHTMSAEPSVHTSYIWITFITRVQPIRGSMPMSDVPLLAWLNRRIPSDTDVYGRIPICRTQRMHMKNVEKRNTCKDRIGSVLACVFQIKIDRLLISVFWSASQTLAVWLHWVRHFGSRPLHCHSAGPVGLCGGEETSMLITATQVKCLD